MTFLWKKKLNLAQAVHRPTLETLVTTLIRNAELLYCCLLQEMGFALLCEKMAKAQNNLLRLTHPIQGEWEDERLELLEMRGASERAGWMMEPGCL